MFRGFVAIGLVAVGLLSLGVAHAQIPGVALELLGRGHMDFSDQVGGPADVSVGNVIMEPGSRYGGGWHTHPGPTWIIVQVGEVAVYGPDNCRTAYAAGSAYVAPADTSFDVRNESAAPVELLVSGLTRAGEAGTIPASEPLTACTR